ncbi:MAG TPA: pyridoxamine 5'-phosphate oxidase family protein [Acidimicrobiia bacterium]|nr:pyridoxamine 5'-phosphate oxidase family protein [Acidimicrobiia bacterium]
MMADDEAGPAAGRPWMFGGELEPVALPWSWAAERLARARHYWISTTRADGRPHSRPVWGVWLGDTFAFSTGSIAARNLVRSDEISVHVENDAGEVVIVEGTAAAIADAELLGRVVDAYNPKYHSALATDTLPGPFYAVTPRVVFGWVSDPTAGDGGAAFHGTATRWAFPAGRAMMES